jgi:hypothetical protein
MADNTIEHILEALIIDLTAGVVSCSGDIRRMTGLSDERCVEMHEQIRDVYKSYNGRNRITKESSTVSPIILKYFVYAHLPGDLQSVSQPIAALADIMTQNLPDCEERTAGLRKLLEAKDCFVRAALEK